MVLRGSYMSLDYNTAGAVFLFFILVGGINVLLKSLGRGVALVREELIIVYVMMIIASAIPTMGLMENLLPVITSGYYYATPENDWADLVHPYIRSWMVLEDSQAIKWFYEGMPQGTSVPWEAWIGPLLCWASFALALYLVMICAMVVLRKQWMEKERLIYPLVQVPLEMLQEDESSSLIGPFFRNPIMWVGFFIPFAIGSLNGLHKYHHFVPGVNLSTSIPVFRNTLFIEFTLSFPMLGFSYFINLDIALGIWLFNLLAQIQMGILSVIGYESTEELTYSPVSPIIAHQMVGAMFVLVLFGLWMARGHLKEVCKKTFGDSPEIDDSGEILSYRTAVLVTIGGLLFMAAWLWASGFPLLVAFGFLFIVFVLFLGVTRIVAEGGVAATRTPLISPGVLVSAIGTSPLGPAGLTALGFSFAWAAGMRTSVMASCAHGLKLIGLAGEKRHLIFWAMIGAILASFISSAWIVLKLAYTYGGINLNQWFFVNGPIAPFDFVAGKINNSTEARLDGWIFTGLGGLVMGLLMFARQRFLWWPVHHLGFPINAVWTTNRIAFSVFLAWLCKALLLKYGGDKLYRRARPFFLGLILGQFSCAGLWLVIDFLTGMTDNQIYFI